MPGMFRALLENASAPAAAGEAAVQHSNLLLILNLNLLQKKEIEKEIKEKKQKKIMTQKESR